MARENTFGAGGGGDSGFERPAEGTASPSPAPARVVGVAPDASLERMSSPTTHPLLDILAAMVREALEYERRERREAA